MRLRYTAVIHFQVAEQLLDVAGLQRSRLLAFLDSLERDPWQTGDYSEPDADDRINQIRIVGRWAVTYWPDHAIREIRVVRLERSDR